MSAPTLHASEPHAPGFVARATWLRAGVLGANDGIVSVSALVVGVAAAGADRGTLFTTGLAGLVAGAVSMAVGEYVSVSSQRDAEDALFAKERKELIEQPEEELAELTAIYRSKGLSAETAAAVAVELTAHDAFAAHVDAELGVDPEDRGNPWAAAASSAVAFTIGALLPFLAIVLGSPTVRVPLTVVAVLAALTLTGTISARFAGSAVSRAVTRVVLGGALGLAVTYGVGALFGTALG